MRTLTLLFVAAAIYLPTFVQAKTPKAKFAPDVACKESIAYDPGTIVLKPEDFCKDPSAAAQKYGTGCSDKFWTYMESMITNDEKLLGKARQNFKDFCLEHKDDENFNIRCDSASVQPGSAEEVHNLVAGFWPVPKSDKVDASQYIDAAMRLYTDDRKWLVEWFGGRYVSARDACRSYAEVKQNGDEDQTKYQAFITAAGLYVEAYKIQDPAGADSLRRLMDLSDKKLAELLVQRKEDVNKWVKNLGVSDAEFTKQKTAADAQIAKDLSAEQGLESKRGQFRDIAGGDAGVANTYLTQRFDEAGLGGGAVSVSGVGIGDGNMNATVNVDWSKVNEDQKKKLLAMGITPPPPGGPTSTTTKVAMKADSLAAGVAAMEDKIKNGQPIATPGVLVKETIAGVKKPENPPSEAFKQGAQGVVGEAAEGHSQKEIQDKTHLMQTAAAADYAAASAKSAQDCDRAKAQFMSTLSFEQLRDPQVQSKAQQVEDECRRNAAQAEADKKKKDDEIKGREDQTKKLEDSNKKARVDTYKGLLTSKRDEVKQDQANVAKFRVTWHKKFKGKADEGARVEKAAQSFGQVSNMLIMVLEQSLQEIDQPKTPLRLEFDAADDIQTFFDKHRPGGYLDTYEKAKKGEPIQ